MIHDGLDYANEKFASAVHEMARSGKSVRHRLFDAYMTFHAVGLFDMPERLKEQYTAIMTRLTAVPAVADEGSLERTLVSISDQECGRLAGMIADLACDIEAEVQCRQRNEHMRVSRILHALLSSPSEAHFMAEWDTQLCERERSG